MPRESQRRIRDLQQVNPVSRPEATRVVASPVNEVPLAPAVSPELMGLAQGLAQLNPALQRYAQVSDTKEAESASKTGQLLANQVLDPMKALSAPDAMPGDIQPAFAANFAQGYNETVGRNYGMKARTAILADYEEAKRTPGFDAEKFLAERTREEFKGVTDPVLLQAATAIHVDTVRSVREDWRKYQFETARESARTMAGENLQMLLKPGMKAEEIWKTYQDQWLPEVMRTGIYTRKEAAEKLLDHVYQVEFARGKDASPEALAFTNLKDPASGASISALPELQQRAKQYQLSLEQVRNKRMSEAMDGYNLRTLLEIDDAITKQLPAGMADPTDLKMRVLANYNPNWGVYRSDDQVRAEFHRIDKASEGNRDINAIRAAMAAGRASFYPNDQVQKVFDFDTAPTVMALFDAAEKGDEKTASDLMAQIATAASTTGSPMTSGPLRRMFDAVPNSIPAPGSEPTPAFKAAVLAWKAMPDQMRGLYAKDEDTRRILETYVDQVYGQRQDPKVALQDAYKVVSPEAKKVAKDTLAAMKKDGSDIKLADEAAWGVVSGWRHWLSYVLPNSWLEPNNLPVVRAQLSEQAKNIIEQNPMIGKDVLEKRLSEYVSGNYVHDSTQNVLTRVPPGQASPKIGEHLSAYTKEVLEKTKAKDVSMVLNNDETDAVRLEDDKGYSSWYTGSITLQSIKDWHRAKTELVPGTPQHEAAQGLLKKMRTEGLSPQDIRDNMPTLDMMRQLKMLDDRTIQQMYGSVNRSVQQTALAHPFIDAPAPNVSALSRPGKGDQASAKLAAQGFLSAGKGGLALTAYREGFVSTATTDPNPAAGANIGFGYNLKANSGNIEKDFKAAGIPVSKLDAIREGRAQISIDQGMKLLEVSWARYEKMAEEQFTEVSKTLQGNPSWGSLPEQARGFLTDLAYQSGNIKQFRSSIEKLVADPTTRATASVNRYFNVMFHNGTSYVPDARGNNLRLAFLTNPGKFRGIIE